MPHVIEVMLVLAAFAAGQERVVEVIRDLLRKLEERAGSREDDWIPWFKEGTINGGSFVVGVFLAVATDANAVLLLRGDGDGFFAELGTFPFLREEGTPSMAGWSVLLGYLIMGAASAFGSRFWHDLAYGLLDARSAVAKVAADTRDARAEAIAAYRKDQ